nr:hypothetical protein [Tanacetum cinerariifolium]
MMDDVSNQGRMIVDMDADADVVLEEAKEERMIADMDVDADVVLEEAKDVVADAKADQDDEVLSMHEEESEPAELQEVVDIVTTTKIITEVVTAASTTITDADVSILAATTTAALRLTTAPSRMTNRVVIMDPKESTNTSTIIHSESKSKDKELNRTIDWDEVIDHVNKKAKEDPTVKRYQALKRKPQTEAQARKNMMIYLKNVAGFKMGYFKGMSYDDIQKAAKRKKLDEEVKELKRRLHIVPNEEDDVYTEATPLAHKVPVVDYEIINQNNKPYYKIKRADGSHQLYLSFLSLLRNFDREDLEALWSLKNQSVYGPAKVKSWKLLESCGVQIITFTTTQLILLVERKYPFTKFTLNLMLNNVRLEVEEESKVSLEMLRVRAELNRTIDWDEVIDHVNKKAKEDPTVKRYQALKRKPQTEAQARKNMMIYLKNVAGFKMGYFKGMSYDDIQKAAKRKKLDEEVKELKRRLHIVPNEEDDVYTEATPLAHKVPVVDYEIINQNNKPYYKIKRADGSHQLYLSFLSLLRNFDREDLEALWSLVKEQFATTKPNFFDDFLLIILGAMFKKPDIHA